LLNSHVKARVQVRFPAEQKQRMVLSSWFDYINPKNVTTPALKFTWHSVAVRLQ
jgi:hypothetical protein